MSHYVKVIALSKIGNNVVGALFPVNVKRKRVKYIYIYICLYTAIREYNNTVYLQPHQPYFYLLLSRLARESPPRSPLREDRDEKVELHK